MQRYLLKLNQNLTQKLEPKISVQILVKLKVPFLQCPVYFCLYAANDLVGEINVFLSLSKKGKRGQIIFTLSYVGLMQSVKELRDCRVQSVFAKNRKKTFFAPFFWIWRHLFILVCCCWCWHKSLSSQHVDNISIRMPKKHEKWKMLSRLMKRESVQQSSERAACQNNTNVLPLYLLPKVAVKINQCIISEEWKLCCDQTSIPFPRSTLQSNKMPLDPCGLSFTSLPSKS